MISNIRNNDKSNQWAGSCQLSNHRSSHLSHWTRLWWIGKQIAGHSIECVEREQMARMADSEHEQKNTANFSHSQSTLGKIDETKNQWCQSETHISSFAMDPQHNSKNSHFFLLSPLVAFMSPFRVGMTIWYGRVHVHNDFTCSINTGRRCNDFHIGIPAQNAFTYIFHSMHPLAAYFLSSPSSLLLLLLLLLQFAPVTHTPNNKSNEMINALYTRSIHMGWDEIVNLPKGEKNKENKEIIVNCKELRVDKMFKSCQWIGNFVWPIKNHVFQENLWEVCLYLIKLAKIEGKPRPD